MATEANPTSREATIDPDTHLTILAGLTFAGAGLWLLFGLIAIWALSFAGQQGYFWTGLGFIPETMAGVAILVAFATALVTIPAIVGAIGLVKRAEWGRILTMAVAAGVGLFALLSFTIVPIVYTVYAFWVLTHDDVQPRFRARPPQGIQDPN